MKKEIWKDIPEYEEFYQVSNFGRVKSLLRTTNKINGRTQTMPDKILKLNYNGNYLSIALHKNAIAKRFRVHKLVALCFLNEDVTRPQINHIDGVKTNNHDWNLERCTASENSMHAIKTGLLIMPNIKGSSNGRSKLTESQVLEIRSLNGKMKQFEIAKKFDVKKAQISTIINRKNWTHI